MPTKAPETLMQKDADVPKSLADAYLVRADALENELRVSPGRGAARAPCPLRWRVVICCPVTVAAPRWIPVALCAALGAAPVAAQRDDSARYPGFLEAGAITRATVVGFSAEGESALVRIEEQDDDQAIACTSSR